MILVGDLIARLNIFSCCVALPPDPDACAFLIAKQIKRINFRALMRAHNNFNVQSINSRKRQPSQGDTLYRHTFQTNYSEQQKMFQPNCNAR